MRNYVLMTDNNADLPDSYMQKHQIGCCYLSYSIDGTQYNHGNFLPVKEFYDKMRSGSMPTTAQVNPESVQKLMEESLKKDLDILYLAFSSALSGSYNTCRLMAEELKEKYPQQKIEVIDTLNASLGQGLIVHKAVQLKEQGKSLEEVAAWIQTHLQNFAAVFTVDDLDNLYRGGRISKTSAIVGGMMNIKPILHVSEEGKLIPIGKIRGRKKSLLALVEEMDKRIGSYKDSCDTIFVSHGDCEADAMYVVDKVKEKYPIQHVLVHPVSATIGAHSGPGTVALFFMTDKK